MDRLSEPAAGTTAPREGRVAGLDLLRAVAILAVLLMHVVNREATGHGWPLPAWSRSFGYFGVELFFILSGFLIGRILIGIADRNPGRRDWATFLVRRWMRTLPLYFLWLVLLLAVSPPPGDFLAMATLYLTFTQNLFWPVPGDWFSVSWSLAVEEWFYLLFSILLLGLAAARVRGAILWSCLLFLTLPLAARIFLIAPGAPFDIGMRQIALARLDAIAWGVLMAWVYLRRPAVLAKWPRSLFFTGCFLLFAPTDLLAAFGNEATFAAVRPFLFTFSSIGFALWIPAALDLRVTSAWFGTAVRWVSDRSYCLYIVHLSIIDFVWAAAERLHLPILLCTPVALVLSAGVAELSFRYFETPILRLRPRLRAAPEMTAGRLEGSIVPTA
jgi:peptidoglycan/LPS O-acetylase OafA/YrhL